MLRNLLPKEARDGGTQAAGSHQGFGAKAGVAAPGVVPDAGAGRAGPPPSTGASGAPGAAAIGSDSLLDWLNGDCSLPAEELLVEDLFDFTESDSSSDEDEDEEEEEDDEEAPEGFPASDEDEEEPEAATSEPAHSQQHPSAGGVALLAAAALQQEQQAGGGARAARLPGAGTPALPQGVPVSEYSITSLADAPVSRRTRAQLSLAELSLEALEAMLVESDSGGEEEGGSDGEYLQFLQALRSGAAPDGGAAAEGGAGAAVDEEDDDDDFSVDLEDLLGDAVTDEECSPQPKCAPVTRARRRARADPKAVRPLQSTQRLRQGQLKPLLPAGVPYPMAARAGGPLPPAAPPTVVPGAMQPQQLRQLHMQLQQHLQLLVQGYALSASSGVQQQAADAARAMLQQLGSFTEHQAHLRQHLRLPPLPATALSAPPGAAAAATTQQDGVVFGGSQRSVSDVGGLKLVPAFVHGTEAARRQLQQEWHDIAAEAVQAAHAHAAAMQQAAPHDPADEASTAQQQQAAAPPQPDVGAGAADEAGDGGGGNGAAGRRGGVPAVVSSPLTLAPSVWEALQVFQPWFDAALLPQYDEAASERMWLPSQDALLAWGLGRFGMDLRRIRAALLPDKSEEQIFNRQKNRSSSRAPDNEIKAAKQRISGPLTDGEIALVRGALAYFGKQPNRWALVHQHCLPYRAAGHLPKLWKDAESRAGSVRPTPFLPYAAPPPPPAWIQAPATQPAAQALSAAAAAEQPPCAATNVATAPAPAGGAAAQQQAQAPPLQARPRSGAGKARGGRAAGVGGGGQRGDRANTTKGRPRKAGAPTAAAGTLAEEAHGGVGSGAWPGGAGAASAFVPYAAYAALGSQEGAAAGEQLQPEGGDYAPGEGGCAPNDDVICIDQCPVPEEGGTWWDPGQGLGAGEMTQTLNAAINSPGAAPRQGGAAANAATAAYAMVHGALPSSSVWLESPARPPEHAAAPATAALRAGSSGGGGPPGAPVAAPILGILDGLRGFVEALTPRKRGRMAAEAPLHTGQQLAQRCTSQGGGELVSPDKAPVSQQLVQHGESRGSGEPVSSDNAPAGQQLVQHVPSQGAGQASPDNAPAGRRASPPHAAAQRQTGSTLPGPAPSGASSGQQPAAASSASGSAPGGGGGGGRWTPAEDRVLMRSLVSLPELTPALCGHLWVALGGPGCGHDEAQVMSRAGWLLERWRKRGTQLAAGQR